jgi:hypothetical protein
MRIQAEAFEHALARPGILEAAGGELDAAEARVAKDSARELRRRCWRVLESWAQHAAEERERDGLPEPIRTAAIELAVWTRSQLGRMEAGDPARVPLLCALAIAGWGEQTLPSVDARSFFAPDGADAVWMAHRLADEVVDLVRGQTLWELATARWQALQDLVWLSRGIRSRPSIAVWDRWRLYPWPPPLPWFDGLDRLRALLTASDTSNERTLAPDSELHLRTLADYQRYAGTIKQSAVQLEVHAVERVTVRHLLTCVGVPAHHQRPIRSTMIDDLWYYASRTARQGYADGVLAELGPTWAPMVRTEPMPRSGPQQNHLSWRLLMTIRNRPALLDLGPRVDEVRLRSQGVLWRAELVSSRGGAVVREASYRIEAGAVARGPLEITLCWDEGKIEPLVRVGDVQLHHVVHDCRQVHSKGCWDDEGQGVAHLFNCRGGGVVDDP